MRLRRRTWTRGPECEERDGGQGPDLVPALPGSAPPAAQASMVILVAATGDAALSPGTAFILALVVAVETGERDRGRERTRGELQAVR